MAISFIEKIAYINKYAQGNKGYEATVKFAKGIDKYPNDKQETIKKAVDKAYADIKAVNTPATSKTATKPSKSKKAVDIKKVLAKFKAKVGTKAYKEATKGTTIKQDSERPALKKGKRFVTKKGYTTNQYGTFKNQVGTAYWETRANRFDVKQPPKSFPKLAKGGKVADWKEFYEMSKDTSGYNSEYEKKFGSYKYQAPHIQEILKKSKSFEDFMNRKNRFLSLQDAQASQSYWVNLEPSVKIAWIMKSGYTEGEAKEMSKKSFDELTNGERKKLASSLIKANDTKSLSFVRDYSEKKFAKGGITEHGLKVGDKIISSFSNAVVVENDKKKFVVNLNVGKRYTEAEWFTMNYKKTSKAEKE